RPIRRLRSLTRPLSTQPPGGSMIDLWPKELSTVDQRSPLTILKEQASLLGEKTQNIVIAVLENCDMFENYDLLMALTMRDYPFKYVFMLTCPALSNYRFRLFSI